MLTPVQIKKVGACVRTFQKKHTKVCIRHPNSVCSSWTELIFRLRLKRKAPARHFHPGKKILFAWQTNFFSAAAFSKCENPVYLRQEKA